MVPGYLFMPFLALWVQCIRDGWEMVSGLSRSLGVAAETRAAEQDAQAEDVRRAPAAAEPQLQPQLQPQPQPQLSTRLHPQDPLLEDLSTAADYPHRFHNRPDGNPDQVEWLEDDDATGNTTWHAPVSHRLHSLNSRETCYLNITNSTPHAVRMMWLDYHGNEVAYEKIAAGAVLRQQTFLTHPWMVREATTGSRLLLNGREAFIGSMQEHREQAAQARARQQALQQQAQLLVQQQGGLLNQQQQPQQGWQAGNQGVQGVGGLGVGVGLGAQLVVLSGPGSNWPLFEVTIGELPQLLWTKETHSLFPAWFRDSTRAFLLCQQKQQRELSSSAAGDSCLGHLPTELLPLIVEKSSPEVPQGVHFPPAGRLDIKPARLSAAPAAAEKSDNDASAAADAPAGAQQELINEGAAGQEQDA